MLNIDIIILKIMLKFLRCRSEILFIKNFIFYSYMCLVYSIFLKWSKLYNFNENMWLKERLRGWWREYVAEGEDMWLKERICGWKREYVAEGENMWLKETWEGYKCIRSTGHLFTVVNLFVFHATSSFFLLTCTDQN